MKIQPKGFAPKEIFREILKWAVIPTFDLIIEYGDQGFIIVKRKISPYKGQWALPGLRMMKGEEIDDTLMRIARDEVGLKINPKQKVYLGQRVGKFQSDQKKQVFSSGYAFRVAKTQSIKINSDHFSEYRLTKKIISPMGAMYKFYLRKYFDQLKGKK